MNYYRTIVFFVRKNNNKKFSFLKFFIHKCNVLEGNILVTACNWFGTIHPNPYGYGNFLFRDNFSLCWHFLKDKLLGGKLSFFKKLIHLISRGSFWHTY